MAVNFKANPFLLKVKNGNMKFNLHLYFILRCTLSSGSESDSCYLNIQIAFFRSIVAIWLYQRHINKGFLVGCLKRKKLESFSDDLGTY